MKTRKLLALLLALAMIMALVAACAEDAVTIDPEAPPEPPPVVETPEPPPADDEEEAPPAVDAVNDLTVIVNLIDSTALPGWSNAVGNAQMRDLTREWASPVAWARNAEFIVNPTIVNDLEGPVENDDGSRTWTITINEGLQWSDGTPITAADYVFSYLFWGSPVLTDDLENSYWRGWNDAVRRVEGMEAWQAGDADVLEGIRFIDEFTYSVTITSETDGVANFPYFYEITYISIDIVPMHVIAPGLTVEDDGEGAFVSGDGLTYDLLRSTVDDGVDGGIRYTMGPTAGPYMLAGGIDMDAEVIVVQRNPYFQGTYDGTMPAIENIILRRVDDALQIPSLQSGEADMIVGASGLTINEAFEELVDRGGFNYIAMPRNGSGGLFFHRDIGPTQFEEVRRAIAWTLDRHEFNNLWAQGHASTNDTLIAVASWMYTENADIIPDLITYNYTLNLAEAVRELEAGGWTLNADGEEWTGPEDGPRHKEVDGELMPLVLRWASPSPAMNPIGGLLSGLMTDPAYSIGMHFDQHFVEGNDFSWALLGTDENFVPVIGDPNHPNRFNMINGGMGIPPIDAVWNTYNPDPETWGRSNWTRADDEELYMYALGRRNASTREEYLEAWKGFIARFNVDLPALPLNADTFHDFYTDRLENYDRNDLFAWSLAIIWANLAEFPR